MGLLVLSVYISLCYLVFRTAPLSAANEERMTMKSNWRFNVLDTITVDLKENPQTVIDRMRRLHYLETGITELDDTGVMRINMIQ